MKLTWRVAEGGIEVEGVVLYERGVGERGVEVHLSTSHVKSVSQSM